MLKLKGYVNPFKGNFHAHFKLKFIPQQEVQQQEN